MDEAIRNHGFYPLIEDLALSKNADIIIENGRIKFIRDNVEIYPQILQITLFDNYSDIDYIIINRMWSNIYYENSKYIDPEFYIKWKDFYSAIPELLSMIISKYTKEVVYANTNTRLEDSIKLLNTFILNNKDFMIKTLNNNFIFDLEYGKFNYLAKYLKKYLEMSDYIDLDEIKDMKSFINYLYEDSIDDQVDIFDEPDFNQYMSDSKFSSEFDGIFELNKNPDLLIHIMRRNKELFNELFDDIIDRNIKDQMTNLIENIINSNDYNNNDEFLIVFNERIEKLEYDMFLPYQDLEIKSKFDQIVDEKIYNDIDKSIDMIYSDFDISTKNERFIKNIVGILLENLAQKLLDDAIDYYNDIDYKLEVPAEVKIIRDFDSMFNNLDIDILMTSIIDLVLDENTKYLEHEDKIRLYVNYGMDSILSNINSPFENDYRSNFLN